MSFTGQINFGYPLTSNNIITTIPDNAVLPLSIGSSLQGNILGVTFADLKSSILSGTSWGTIIGNINLQTDLISLFGTKQNTLVSGNNIKTVNGNSLVGSGGISLTKIDIGLPNVNNTSDVNKPISNATQTVLNAKADLIGGLVPITQIPPAAIERLIIVANQVARFALTTASVQNGDTVKQSDTGEFYYVIDQTNLNNASGYAIYTAGTASSVAWTGITGVPTPVSTLTGTNTGDQDLSLLAPKSSPTFTGTVTAPVLILSSETAFTIASFDGSKNVKSLSTVTYPSLTELSYVKGATSSVQSQLNAKSPLNLTLDRKTSNYTLVAGDNGKVIEMNVATANTLTINTGLFSAGNQVLISQYGAGQVSFVAGSGVTIRSASGKLKLTGQYSMATIIAISTTEFYLSGDLTV